MTRETRITVPEGDAPWIARRMAEIGLTVLDTGERVTTDEGVDAEAVLHVASFDAADEQAPIRESLMRP